MVYIKPYDFILKELVKKKVKYLVIGVFGINYYTSDSGQMFSTQDCDILVKNTSQNLYSALKILEKEGFVLEANREPIGKIDRWLAEKIIKHKAVVVARKGKVLRIDVVLNGGKIPYNEWDKNKKNFIVGKIKIPVGNLTQLLRAKENAGREKDRVFLKLYKIQLKEIVKEKSL